MVAKRNIDKRATDVLKAWLLSEEHFAHPYPTIQERHELASKAGIDPKQVLNWFVNARKRIWQPLLMEMGEDVKKYLSTGRCCSAAKRKAVEAEKQAFKRPRLVPPAALVAAHSFDDLLRDDSEDSTLKGGNFNSSHTGSASAGLASRTTFSAFAGFDFNDLYSNGSLDLFGEDLKVDTGAAAAGSSSSPSNQSSRSRTSSDFAGTRKGQWTEEEETYAHRLIWAFENGLLNIEEGTTLRAYLAKMLNCPPMRISKKFVGADRIGKLLYSPKPVDPLVLSTTEAELKALEAAFHSSIVQDQMLRPSAATQMRVMRGVDHFHGSSSLSLSGGNSPASSPYSGFSPSSSPGPSSPAHSQHSDLFESGDGVSILPRVSSLQWSSSNLDQTICDLLADEFQFDMSSLMDLTNDPISLFDENATLVDVLPAPTSYSQSTAVSTSATSSSDALLYSLL